MDAAASKRDFGSFHSSNVEELLRLPEASSAPHAVLCLSSPALFVCLQEVYKPPKIPVDLPSFSSSDLKFGQEAKEAHFHLSVRTQHLMQHSINVYACRHAGRLSTTEHLAPS